MDNVVVAQSQSMFDLAVQEYGTPLAVLTLAFENGLSVTDELEPGSLLALPFYEGTKTDVAAYYAKKSILPSTGQIEDLEEIIEGNDECNLCKCFT